MITQKISKEQCSGFGQVCVLFLLLLSLLHPGKAWVLASGLLLLVNILVPLVFYPFAWVWFLLGKWLGNITSSVILSIIFLIVVIPVGLIRKMRGKNPLRLSVFKKGKHSVFTDRHHEFVAEDLKHGF
ncbi:SxtJ family membrane protein [Chitinophagaceae bacterium 26-R-25]|nr:SxtJ family membrane protein [Chitinophagaceae bacterium 26-R-25]